MTSTISFSQNQSLATISFNRPDAMNSFNEAMAQELEAITEQVRNDTSIRAVLLKGEGSLFMAGGDIRFFQSNLQQMSKFIMKMIRHLNASIINLMQMPKPVLASVHGSVAGVGMSFMMAADLVIAAEDTKFTMAYSGLGASPDGGASYNLPRIVGSKKALEMIMFSELLDAKTMHQLGLINWVTSAAKLTEETETIVKRLVNGPTLSLRPS